MNIVEMGWIISGRSHPNRNKIRPVLFKMEEDEV